MADQFCLRWNNFQTNIVSALDSLKCSEDLVDVTLTCEGKNVKAHKVILSACSPYFRNVFKENPCQHPVIILKDVSADDIVNLLSYMYQGEVYIEESKLSSFLHTAALLQVKGLTGVTPQKDNYSLPNPSNKLYSQLTISSRGHLNAGQKELKIPTLKKRRSSTSDKPYDSYTGEGHKKNKIIETYCDPQCKTKLQNVPKVDYHNSPVQENTNVTPEKKTDNKLEQIILANGKNANSTQQPGVSGESLSTVIKMEQTDENSSQMPQSYAATESEDTVPDYENSMLARSLLSGINPSKTDMVNSSIKKASNLDTHSLARSKDLVTESIFTGGSNSSNSPSKSTAGDDTPIKAERLSPKSDVEFEPEILLSEHQDCDAESSYSQESQALLLLAGMSAGQGLNSGASTSQGVSHQSNHAAICGNCPHCGMKYSNQSALKYHVRLMHSDLTNRLCCYLCPRSFTMRETFKEHMWTSHGQRN